MSNQQNEKAKKPWCLCAPGVGPHDDDCPARQALAVERLTEAVQGVAPNVADAAAVRVNVGDVRRVLRMALPPGGDGA